MEKTAHNFIKILRETFQQKLQAKTGWGDATRSFYFMNKHFQKL